MILGLIRLAGWAMGGTGAYIIYITLQRAAHATHL